MNFKFKAGNDYRAQTQRLKYDGKSLIVYTAQETLMEDNLADPVAPILLTKTRKDHVQSSALIVTGIIKKHMIGISRLDI